MDYNTYRQLIGPANKSCIIPHYSIPSHNLISKDILNQISADLNNPELEWQDEFLSQIPCYESFEYKVHSVFPMNCGSGGEDVALKVLKEKEAWERKLKTINIGDIGAAIRTIKTMRNNEPTKVSRNMRRYIKHLRRDPEPHFSGQYNWLYTGGNIQIVNLDRDFIVLGADNSMSSAALNVIKLNADLSEIETSEKFLLKKNAKILQVSSKSNQSQIIVAVRQKNIMNVYKFSSFYDCDISKNCWRKKTNGKKFFTSLDIGSDFQTVVVADSKSDLHVFDVETKQKLYGFAARVSEKDNWNQVLSGNDTIYMANRDVFSVLDSRDPLTIPVMNYSPSSVTNECEDICGISKSERDCNYFYLATSHNLIQIDLRNQKSVQRWTHLMKNSPQFLYCAKDDCKDILVLQSAQVDETIGITNEFKKIETGSSTFISKSLPCALTTVKEALKTARMNGLALHPRTAKRFEFSPTGIQCLKNGRGDIHLFTINSAGDIFLSRLIKTKYNQNFSDNDKKIFLVKMSRFEKELNDVHMKKTCKSSLKSVNLKRIRDDLKSRKVSEAKHGNRGKGETFWKESEMFSGESLLNYRDVMSQKILHVWGLVDDGTLDLNETISSDAKVQEWMNRI